MNSEYFTNEGRGPMRPHRIGTVAPSTTTRRPVVDGRTWHHTTDNSACPGLGANERAVTADDVLVCTVHYEPIAEDVDDEPAPTKYVHVEDGSDCEATDYQVGADIERGMFCTLHETEIRVRA